MASKRRKRNRMCGKKVRHPNFEAARYAIVQLNRKRGHQGQLHVYLCPFCKNYHVGHVPGGNGLGSGYRG